MKKHILVLNQFAVPRSAAGGTRHAELFGMLSGWDANILAGRTTLAGERLPVDPLFVAVPVTPYKGNGVDRIVNWASYSAMALARGLFRRGPVDMVCGSSPHLGAALAALIIARVRRARFVLEVRDLWPQILVEAGSMSESSWIYRLLKRLELFLYDHADLIVVLSEGSRTSILSHGIDSDRVVLIPNGADPADFEVTTDREELRKRYGFAGFTVVYAGAHGPANGLKLVLEAAEALQAEPIAATIVLIGDGVEKGALIEEAQERGLSNVVFLDPIAKREIPMVLKAADAGLHCLADVELFRTGVSPNKLYDYMAAGLPVVTNTGGDIAKMVLRAGSGIAVPPASIVDGVRLLSRSSAAELEGFGAAGLSFMQGEHSRTAMAHLLEQTLNDLA